MLGGAGGTVAEYAGEAVSPITTYPETYNRMNLEAQHQMSRGLDQTMHPDGAMDVVKGVANMAAAVWAS
jgi:hypothetical protein